jgi:hypothetical protein
MMAYCVYCNKPCTCKIINEGIGNYEYWGVKSYDKQLVVVSSCCGEPCIDSTGDYVSPQDVKDHDDYMKAEHQGADNED